DWFPALTGHGWPGGASIDEHAADECGYECAATKASVREDWIPARTLLLENEELTPPGFWPS
ncbi:hypothetical protein ACWPM1_14730, partial [Tsuneonella sp. HG249]